MQNDTSHDPRTDRILEVAMSLAEADGYDAVRLRDLAKQAEVALGTVYRRFSSKEDILAAVLERMVRQFHDAVKVLPVPGTSVHERLVVFLEMATQQLAATPKLAAALLRTVACGEPAVAERVLAYRSTMTELLLIVMRGHALDAPPSPAELQLARITQNLWFAEMVGWTGGLQSSEEAMDAVNDALATYLEATEAP